MKRYLFRVQYTYPDATTSYESVCVRAGDTDETTARVEVTSATDRYMKAARATRALTLLLVTPDV